MQACCCGVAPPKPGPPGAITGLIRYPPNTAPGDLSVYAIDQYSSVDATTYTVSRVLAGDTSYRIDVPPGIYYVVARFDRDPLRLGGYTFHIACSVSCDTEAANYNLPTLRVESTAVIADIEVGDWGLIQPPILMWDVDMYGSPASLIPHYSPSPKTLASRSFPPASFDPTLSFAKQSMGLALRVPAGWQTVTPAFAATPYFTEAYFTNEAVTSPLGLDSSGVWLTTRIIFESGCPFPDWRYATARATVKMQGASNHFFFEDPRPRDGPQPFTGYSVRGGDFVFGNCAEFILTGSTQQALDDNLPAFAALVETAKFTMPCTVCTTPSASQS